MRRCQRLITTPQCCRAAGPAANTRRVQSAAGAGVGDDGAVGVQP
jgi:hypothetical protein